MTVATDGVPEVGLPTTARTIPVYSLWLWSVRRELWENRSVVMAPLAVATLVFIGFVIRALHFADLVRRGRDDFDGTSLLSSPAHLAAFLILATTTVVSVFYCADALHGERSDRSILFWKSLPVSDRLTVLSKASIPFVVLPLLAFAIVVVTLLLMMASTVLILGSVAGGPIGPLLQLFVTLLYGLFVLALWHAPIYAWLLFVSSWARRMVFLTALLPLLAVALVERIAFGTGWFGHAIKQRLFGFGTEGFVLTDRQIVPNPAGLLTSPSLWIGLAVAAALLAATVWTRRRMGPI